MRSLILSVSLLIFGCDGDRLPVSPPFGDSGDLPAFIEITEPAGLGAFRHTNGGFGEMWMPEIMGSGGGFIDYDGDDWPDVLLVGGGSLPGRSDIDRPAVYLFRNQGDGTFQDVTEDAGLANVRAYGQGIVAADYDNDGDTDFFLTTLERDLLFQNTAGVFAEAGEAAGLQSAPGWSSSALFFDADRDGRLDLYVASYLQWTPDTDLPCIDAGKRDYCNPRTYRGAKDHFYINEGEGVFSDRTLAAGFDDPSRPRTGKGLGVAELDFNEDGWPDLYVANDGEPNFLFKNRGDGSFEEIALTSGVAVDQNGTARAGMGVDAGVVDSTGKITLFVGNFSAEMVGVWRYDRDDFFTDRANRSQIGFPSLRTLTFGLGLFDVDLDTDLDLLMVNGHVMKYIAEKQIGISFRQPPQLFVNAGDGTFSEAPPGAGFFEQQWVGRGLATADIDRDGDLDILVTENDGPAHLWRNDLANGKSLRVRLDGVQSNRDGIGARIRATLGGLVMERRIHSGSSYLSQSELTATFGLGNNAEIENLEVAWPSGRLDRFENIPADREILITEGNTSLDTLRVY